MNNKNNKCDHEYGSYKGTKKLWCSNCGIELDLITRKPVNKEKEKYVTQTSDN
jgi:hypothetical protein